MSGILSYLQIEPLRFCRIHLLNKVSSATVKFLMSTLITALQPGTVLTGSTSVSCFLYSPYPNRLNDLLPIIIKYAFMHRISPTLAKSSLKVKLLYVVPMRASILRPVNLGLSNVIPNCKSLQSTTQ